MDCNDAQRLIDADTDGELDLVRHLELAAHQRTCAACARLAETARARRTALRASLPRFTAPPALAAQIRSRLLEENKAPSSPRHSPGLWSFWNLTGLAASFALMLAVGFCWGQHRARTNLLIDEAVSGHVRSLQAGHLTDVASTDRHTVKPWFAGKLDFSPPVYDLSAAGYPLSGGRLEQIDGRPGASLVFHRRQHAINLFIWPARSGAVPARQSTRHGYQTVSWTVADLNFLAVSEISAAELGEFVAAYRAVAP